MTKIKIDLKKNPRKSLSVQAKKSLLVCPYGWSIRRPIKCLLSSLATVNTGNEKKHKFFCLGIKKLKYPN